MKKDVWMLLFCLWMTSFHAQGQKKVFKVFKTWDQAEHNALTGGEQP